MSREACIELAESTGVDPDELLEWWAERAAVREYDGNQPRPEAERDALEDMRAMLEIGPWILGGRKGPRSMTSPLAAKSRQEEKTPTVTTARDALRRSRS